MRKRKPKALVLAEYRERIRIFIAAVTAGASDRSAAAEANISSATVHRWLHGERPFDETMRKAIFRARAVRERRWLQWIEDAATPGTDARGQRTGDWRAAQFLLSVTNPAFAPRSRTEVSGPGGEPVRIEADVVSVLEQPDLERLNEVVGLLHRAGAVPLLEAKAEANGNGHK